MLEINRLDFHLTVEVLDIERLNFPSVRTDIKIHFDLASTKSNLHFKSVWFGWDSVEAFLISLRQMVETNSGFAEIKDMSEEFVLHFSKSATATLLTFKSEQETLLFNTTFSIEVDSDTMNIVHRQVSEFVREIRALA